jgi:uracil-DNA glycosylase
LIAAAGQVKTRMVHITDQSAAPGALKANIAAALDWWREAGVDHDYHDDPRDWLPAQADPAVAEPPPQLAPPPPPARPAYGAAPQAMAAVGGPREGWPQRLEDFGPWWLTEPSLDHGIVMDRIAPRGPPGAALMVLVDQPEAGDRDQLLSGPQGTLLDAFLRAAGLDRDQVYVAAALCRHTPMPDWSALTAAGLDSVTTHHVGLAAPQRLIVLGANLSPLLGHDPTLSAESLRSFNHEGRTIPALAAPGLEDMLARPRRKAVLWQRWLDWTGQDS